MGSISASALRRLYLLYLLSRFERGAFGAKRVHKVAYISERQASIHPFGFKRYYYGQYSELLDDLKDQLESMGYVLASPLDTAVTARIGNVEVVFGGNRFTVADRDLIRSLRKALEAVDPSLPVQVDVAVKHYGYLKEQELLDLCYHFPEFQAVAEGETIFESDLPDSIEINLPDEEVEDLELSLTPQFVIPMLRLAEALDEVEIDWNRVTTVEGLPNTIS